MGQQQLLLIILGVIIVGLAIAVGITMFSDNAVSANRDAMSSDLIHIAAKAKHYFSRPSSMGGGGYSFVGLTADDAGMLKLVSQRFLDDNPNGTYIIKTAGDANEITLQGTGKAPKDDGTFPILECRVTRNSQQITIIQ